MEFNMADSVTETCIYCWYMWHTRMIVPCTFWYGMFRWGYLALCTVLLLGVPWTLNNISWYVQKRGYHSASRSLLLVCWYRTPFPQQSPCWCPKWVYWGTSEKTMKIARFSFASFCLTRAGPTYGVAFCLEFLNALGGGCGCHRDAVGKGR